MTIKKLLFTFTLIITIGFTTQAKALTFAEYIYNNVKANNISSVKKFLNRGYNIDAPGPNGQTALCIALSKNDFATYKKIKELGANTSHHCTKKYSDKTSDKQINTPPKKTPEQTKVTSPSLNSSSIGVGLLVAGGAALALSGGGGGGGGSSSNDNNEETEPEEPPFTCPENYGLLNGECVPINTSTKCLEGEEKVNGKCQKITCKEGYHLVGNSCLKDEEKSDNVEDIDDNIHAPTTNINIENIDTNKDVFGVLSTTNEVYNLFSAYIHPDDYKEINILNKGYGRVIALYGESKTMNSFVDGFRDKSKDEINTKPNGTGKINITNHGTGSVYGVYSRILDAQNQYEAANAYAADEATATGIINIYNDGGSATYGVFSDDRAYNNASRGKASSYGEINIKANGDITGIGAYMAIMNSHSHQFDAGKYAKGNINIESFGNGNIYGVHVQKDIKETVNDHIEQWFAINAAGTYNDDVEGNINIKNSGNGNVYGMYGGQQLYNALFYGAHNGPSISNIVGNINIFNKGKGEVYGMYMPEADAIGKIANISFEGNKREDGTQTSVKSTINIVNLGKGSATGLRGGQFNHIENSGEININSLNKGTVYGIYGERHTNIQNSGLLNLQRQDYTDPKTNTTYTTKGKQQGTIYGIYAQGQADVENSGIINISNASDATGVYLEEGAFLNNMGTITLADNKNARGIYAKEKASVSNSGNINITNSSKGEGIYLEKEASLDNSGTITIDNTKTSYGIYAKQNSYIKNSGTITISNASEGTGIYLEKDVSLENTGKVIFNDIEENILSNVEPQTPDDIVLTTFSQSITDLNRMGEGEILLGANGSFFADTLKGDLGVATSAVKNDFKDTYTITSSINANNIADLNLYSKSAMFKADTKQTDDNKYDVVLTRKNFNELVKNNDVADFFEQNYQKQNNQKLYDSLKQTTSIAKLNQMANNLTANDVIPTFRKQNILIQQNISQTFDDNLFNTPKENYIAGFKYIDISNDDTASLEKSNATASTAYGLLKNKSSNDITYGIGLNITKLKANYDNNSKRTANQFGLWIPAGYDFNNGLKWYSKLYAGYSDSSYDRISNKTKYSADYDEYQYGIDNEIRYNFTLGNNLTLSPLAELNIQKFYQDEIVEKNASNSLNIKSQNQTSMELGIGAYLKKEHQFNNDQSLGIQIGGLYYVELLDKDKNLRATMNNMDGNFDIQNKLDRNRAALSLKATYKYKNLTLYGNVEKELNNDNSLVIDTGLQYNF